MVDTVPDSYRVAGEELRQFVERFERLEIEKKDISDQQKTFSRFISFGLYLFYASFAAIIFLAISSTDKSELIIKLKSFKSIWSL